MQQNAREKAPANPDPGAGGRGGPPLAKRVDGGDRHADDVREVERAERRHRRPEGVAREVHLQA